jgi:hypothetical protein
VLFRSVEFSRRASGRHIIGQADEVVSELTHGGHHHDNIVAIGAGTRDVVGDGADAFGITDGRSAKFLDN